MDWKKHGVVKVHDYTFDVENRLTSIFTNSTHTMSFAYDADGQRVKTTRTDGTVIYSPFPDYEVEDPSTGANIIRTTYHVAGQIVAVQTKVGTNSVFRYTYTDHLGNIVALSEGNNYVRSSLARYDPFGNYRTTPDESVNPDITNHGFTGHRMNNTGEFPIEKVGLIYMNARYYLPEVGRFISADTIVSDPGNPQSCNRYGYAYNNPVNYTDPTGHCPFCVGALIGGIGGFGISYGAQVVANISQNGLTVDAFTDVNWSVVGAGTVAGAVGGATFGLGTAAVGTGTLATIGSGAASGALAGQAGRATENALSGQNVLEGLGEPGDIAVDAIIGGVSAGIFKGIQNARSVAPASGASNFAGTKQLMSHFEKHGAEFGFESADDYLSGARNLLSGGRGIETFRRANGDTLFYNAATNEFGVKAHDGAIRTYFRPERGLDYWMEQIGNIQ